MPNATCDLHLHTYYSDGAASPGEILHYAAEIGLKTVAITDHDNLHAATEANHVADSLGIELIPGVECTCRWDDCPWSNREMGLSHDIDLLGYFFNPQDAAFLKFVEGLFQDIRERISECCARLTASGYPVNIYDVLDENPRYPGAMQLISALWHKGYADSWGEAFPLFAGRWPYVRPSSFTIQQVIAALHEAGGVAVLAHPVAIECEGGWLQAAQMAQLAEIGLDGLEVLHPRLDARARAHFLALAKQFNLVVTGGSDEHGWNDGFTRMGSELVTYEMVHALRERSQRNKTGA